MNRTIFLSLLSALCFTACSSDDEETANVEKPIPVVVNITEEPMVDEAAGARTRTVPITTSTLSSFYMEFNDGSAWNHYEWTKSGSGWSSSMTWPEYENTLTFYAYRDNETDENSRMYGTSNPYITISVDENANNQHDVLAAKSKAFTSSEKGSSVDLSFKHICSAVRFTISKTSGMSDYTIVVKDVKLCNVIKQGDYYFNADSWTLSSTKTNYTLNNSEITLTEVAQALTADNHYHFLLPQTLTAWDKSSTLANTYLKLECKISKGGNYKIGSAESYGYAYLPISGTLEQGVKRTINLKVGTALRKIDEGKVTQISTL